MPSMKRLLRELKDLNKQYSKTGHVYTAGQKKLDPSDMNDIVLFPRSEDNLLCWSAFIIGPPDTPFSNARFELRINILQDYPLVPPKMRFITKICHPNVHFKTGEICLDVLKEQWTPIWTLESACRAIVMLLGAPEASSPLNCDAGNLIRCGDWCGYNSLARMYTLDYAQILTTTTTKKKKDDDDDVDNDGDDNKNS